ncbi:hypothetical protein A2U01_0054480, partial [Trifolium medium]|nr:hypothetical protein [Trifolium medium]
MISGSKYFIHDGNGEDVLNSIVMRFMVLNMLGSHPQKLAQK